MSNACIEAAEAAVNIISRMRDDGTLSSRVLFDTHCIGDLMGILIMALQLSGGAERQSMLQLCLETHRSMEKTGWCERLSPELEESVAESGFLQPGTLQSVQHMRPLEPFDPRAFGFAPAISGDNDMAAFLDFPDL